MYFSGWILLVVISLAASFAAFTWGMKSGQFTNQERARYLPLADGLPPPPEGDSSRLGAEAYGLIVVLILGFMVLMAPVVMILYRLRG